MICSFRIKNYLSFREETLLDFRPESLKEKQEYLHIPYLYDSNIRLLKSIALYGYNSFGKSNVIKAYSFFLESIFKSFIFGSSDNFFERIDSFSLNTQALKESTGFEIIFLIRETQYRYSYEVFNGKIVKEELWYSKSKERENYLFIRAEDVIKTSNKWMKNSGQIIDHSKVFTKTNHLFLSVLLSQNTIDPINKLGDWLKSNIVISDLSDSQHLMRAMMILSQEKYRSMVQKFIDAADLGFKTIFDKIDSHSNNKLKIGLDVVKMILSYELESFSIYTEHDVYDREYKFSYRKTFELIKNESAGSIKYLILACYLTLTIKEGFPIWIDELDAQLHVHLFDNLIQLYNHNKINTTGSQMIFTTHNISLLSDKSLRRDQIMAVHKNEFGESSIVKIHNKENPLRQDASFDKKYLSGKVGVSKRIKENKNLPTLGFNVD